MFPLPVLVALKVGTVPTKARFEESFSVIETFEVADPFATTDPVPEMLEFTLEAAPAIKVTVPPLLPMGLTIDNVFVSEVVDASVQVELPKLLVTEQEP